MRPQRPPVRLILSLAALAVAALGVGRWALREPAEEPPSFFLVRATGIPAEPRAEPDVDDGGGEHEDEDEGQALSDGEDEGEVDAGPREPGTLALEVVELATGDPARHLRLQLAQAEATEPAPQVVETDASGRAFADLPEGLYLIAPVGGSWALDVESAAVTARSTNKVRLLVAPSASLRCRVVDEAGAPVAGASVEATAPGGVHASVEATSDADGVAVLAPLFPDRWSLSAELEGFERGFVSVNAGRPNAEVRLMMKRAEPCRRLDGGLAEDCRLSGQVVDSRGSPAIAKVDARLGLAPVGTVELGLDGWSGEQAASGRTALGSRVWLFDSAGESHFSAELPAIFDSVSVGRARYYLHASRGAASGSVTVQAGETSRVSMALGTGGGVRLSGRLLHGRSGDPLGGVHVQLPVPFEGDAWPQAVAETGADGRFTFVGAARGRATICAHREGFLVTCWVGDLQGDLELGEVRLEPGATEFPGPEALGFAWAPAPGGARVARVEAGSASGLEVGDLVIAVDGRATDGLGEADLEVLLAGPADGVARLDVVRSGAALKLGLSR
jgi:hypothetical protein